MLCALLTACAQPGGTASGGNDGGTADDLHVEYDPGDGSTPGSWTLTCGDAVGGTHPDAQAACEHLAGLDDPFAPLPDDIACTEQYGGPQTARVTGLWRGEDVDLELSRTDGCRISQWDGLVPLVPPGS
ncbi:MAG TPA: SSI family serine proteinase inhibitor [Blastococcus sp.]|nr:SSI family serine proteinase inhibitor [Blastococcus sp.]